jgi:hypothetical protein
MTTLEEVSIDDELDREIQSLSTDDIVTRTRLLENEIKVGSPCCVVRVVLTADYEIGASTVVA